MIIIDFQHRNWYIVSLLPHLRVSLSQQRIVAQTEALEIVRMLDASTIQDMNLGVKHIHSQLQSLHLELQSLKKGKEAQLEVHAEETWT